MTEIPPDDVASVQRCEQAYNRLRDELAKVIVGQHDVIEQVLIAIFARGHALLEGVPGLAKTLLVSSLAEAMDLSFKRIQFTPDLMPSDVTGADVIQENPETGAREYRFLRGPLFANLILADEINRTPPKTQASMLEAMQERQISAGGTVHKLPNPFFVLATQNPLEQEGTYPLPEAQLDRFMFKVVVPFLSRSEMNEVVSRTILKSPVDLPKLLDSDKILQFRKTLEKVVVTDAIRDYAVRLVLSTHPDSEFATERVKQFVKWGASPRAAQALIRAARVRALADGRPHVAFEDIRSFAGEVLQHRVLLNYDGQAESLDLAELVQECVKSLPETA